MKASQMSLKKKNVNRGINVIMILILIVFIIPIYIVLLGAFKGNEEVIRYPLSLPKSPSLDNFRNILNDPSINLIRTYINSIFLTVVSAALTLVLAASAAYYTGRTKSKWASSIYIYFIFGMMIPYQMAFLGVVQILKRLNWIGTYVGMISVFIAGNLMFSVFMYHGFIKSIPGELEESASLDGAGQFRIFLQIILPLLKPCTATTCIFVALGVWNDFYTPLIVLGGGEMSTITLGIYNSIGQFQTNWGGVFAYVIMASAPAIVAYIAGQKYIVEGIAAGALKG